MSIDADLRAAQAVEQQGDLVGSEQLLVAAVDRYPDDERPLLKLGWLLHRQKKRDEADDVFRKVLNGHYALTDPKAHGAAFDEHCHMIFRRDGVNEASLGKVKWLCDADAARHGINSWTALFHGALAFCHGDEAEAFARFEECVSLGDSLLGNSYGSFSYRDDCFVERLLSYKPGRSDLMKAVTRDHLKYLPQPDDAVVYVLSCDGFYFESFARKVAQSLNQFRAASICHIHVINSTEASREMAKSIFQEFPDLRINVTDSEIDFPEGTIKLDKKAFFTCGRFLVMPEIARLYDLPMLITEFDCELTHEPADYARSLRQVDIGLSFYDHMNFFPWNTVWAGTVYVGLSELALEFSTLVAKYCAIFLDPYRFGGKLWHVDQNALHCVHRFMLRRRPGLLVRDVKTSMPSLLKHYGGIY